MNFTFKTTYLTVNGADLFTLTLLPDDMNKFPTVIFRNPYVDHLSQLDDDLVGYKDIVNYNEWMKNGYAVVIQHCRGRGKSTGDCIPYINEREDGLNLQEWIRKQPFYNGELYLCGES